LGADAKKLLDHKCTTISKDPDSLRRAKHVLSRLEGTPRTQSDGLRSVIPSDCEGSEKDFSRSLP
jgi:hypothetical protein